MRDMNPRCGSFTPGARHCCCLLVRFPPRSLAAAWNAPTDRARAAAAGAQPETPARTQRIREACAPESEGREAATAPRPWPWEGCLVPAAPRVEQGILRQGQRASRRVPSTLSEERAPRRGQRALRPEPQAPRPHARARITCVPAAASPTRRSLLAGAPAIRARHPQARPPPATATSAASAAAR